MSGAAPGCCADRACSDSTCMRLPAGRTCGDCAHAERCVGLFGARREDTACGFYPRRFVEARRG